MKTSYHGEQALHQPQTYFSRGKMRTPQEVPERTIHLLAPPKRLGFDVILARAFLAKPSTKNALLLTL